MSNVGVPNLVEISLIKDEKKLILIVQTLNGVGNAGRKVPDIAVADFRGLVDTILIDSRDGNSTIVDEAPFSL